MSEFKIHKLLLDVGFEQKNPKVGILIYNLDGRTYKYITHNKSLLLLTTNGFRSTIFNDSSISKERLYEILANFGISEPIKNLRSKKLNKINVS